MLDLDDFSLAADEPAERRAEASAEPPAAAPPPLPVGPRSAPPMEIELEVTSLPPPASEHPAAQGDPVAPALPPALPPRATIASEEPDIAVEFDDSEEVNDEEVASASARPDPLAALFDEAPDGDIAPEIVGEDATAVLDVEFLSDPPPAPAPDRASTPSPSLPPSFIDDDVPAVASMSAAPDPPGAVDASEDLVAESASVPPPSLPPLAVASSPPTSSPSAHPLALFDEDAPAPPTSTAPRAPSQRPASFAPRAPSAPPAQGAATLGDIDPLRELFGDEPRVDLGAAPPAESGFADLALGDDELDEMFRDLEAPIASEPAPRAPTPAPPAVMLDETPLVDFEFGPAPEPPVALEETAEPEVAASEEDETGDELVFEDGDEEEIVLEAETPAAPDRGAMLAATVTSRKRAHEASDAIYGLDARAEAIARAEMLSDEAGQDTSYLRAGDVLAIVAETLEGVSGDRARARVVADRAYALAPESGSTLRAIRRLDLAEGDAAAAYARTVEELRGELSPAERAESLRLAAELAAEVAPSEAAALWDELAAATDVTGALAALFAGAARRDDEGEAGGLARWSDLATGELAASLGVARARRVESRSADDALDAIRDAVRRDPSDAGAWIAMARIAVARVRADVLSEALAGLARVGRGAAASAAEALRRALDGALGQTVTPGVVDDGGVAAWLVARAQDDAGIDAGPQVREAMARSEGEALRRWKLRAGEPDDRDALGRYHSLRRAAVSRRDDELPALAAAFLGAGAVAEAALAARAGEVSAREASLLGGASTVGALLSASVGHPWVAANADDAFAAIDRAERTRRDGDVEGALTELVSVAGADAGGGASSYAARAVASLTGEPSRAIEMLRLEAARASDPRRGAASRVVGAALATAYGAPDGASELLAAAEVLPGDIAVAELAALLALRGEIDPEVGAELLDQAASAGDGRAHHTAAVRAALRRAAVDPDTATEAVWRAWLRCPKDASLGTLVLRSPAQVTERVVAVLRTQLEAAHAAGPAGATAAIAEALLLAASLESAGRHAEAAQAIARARTLAIDDASLTLAEERLWLRAGMFAEVAERAFDQLRAATDDDERVAAYERLAELDRTYRGDVASSVLSFQAILEIAPGHVASQRTLERYFIEQGRSQELLDLYQRMTSHAADPDDALAYTHAAARLAVSLADGDVAAAGPFLRGAFARSLADRRLVVGLDAEARRTGDLTLFAEASLRAAQLAGNDLERATSFLRAAEGFLALGEIARGREALEHALAVEPNHLAALLHAADERFAAGDARAAADAWETLGRRARVPEHAREFLHRAAERWAPSDPDRAFALAREVLAAHPAHAAAWELAAGIARSRGDTRAEMELVALRTDAGVEPAQPADRAALHRRAAELAQSLGDVDRARAEWRKVLEVEPDRVEALREVARLAWEAEDWAAAADACIRLAKATKDNAERAEQLFRLGEIFDLRIPDPKRAEAAYRRVVQAAPDDTRAHERLVALFQRTGEAQKEFEVLQALTARTMPGPQRIARLLRVAELAETAASDLSRAELAYEGARREAPKDVEVLRAYARFLERSAAGEARKVLFERAGAEARRGVDLAPKDPANYDILVELRHLRRDDVAARAVASVAMAVGVHSEIIDANGTPTPEHALGPSAIDAGAVDLLSPPSVPAPLRTLLQRAGDVLAAAAPFDARAAGAESLGGRPHPLRPEIEAWARDLGWPSVEIYVASEVPEVVRPVGGVRAFVVPVSVSPSVGLRFAVARAVLLEAVGLGLAVRLAPRQLALEVAALLRQFEPMHRPPNVDAAQLDEHARKMVRALPRDRHAELSPLAFQVIERGPIDAEALRSGAWELGNRLALLATDDMPAAVALLATTAAATPDQLTATTPLGRLLRVSLNDRFADARRVAREAARGR